jgi:hypothetical protein
MTSQRTSIILRLKPFLPESRHDWLNALQDLGLCSDLAQTLSEVPDCDLLRALNFFEGRKS